MNKTRKEQLRALNELKTAQKNEKIENLVKNVLANYPKGFIIKEVSVDSNLNGWTTRKYIHDLVEEGRVKEIGKDGKSVIYILSDFLTDKQEQAAKEEVAKVEETVKEEPQKVCAGREFENPRSVTSVVAGDISWVSSRSGNGLFFRYLILIVHSYKATCVNVFPEGHEAVNINDPNFIFVGTDPESGENLYADLTNVCQRRFSAFGERCMHISPEPMENVKNRMARLLKVDIHPVGDQGRVKKLRDDLAKISTDYTRLNNDYNKLNDEFSAYKVNRQNYIEGLHQQFKGIIHEKKEADKANDELQARLDASVGVIDKLTAENDDLKAKLADLQETHQECVDSGVLETEDSDHLTDLYIILAKYEAQKELLEKQLGEYLAIIDRLLPANKEV
jgi:predicted transcriptional regulator